MHVAEFSELDLDMNHSTIEKGRSAAVLKPENTLGKEPEESRIFLRIIKL